MAYLRLPDNSYFTIPEGATPQEAYALARKKYPEAFEPPKPKDTGFTGALKASTEELKGDIGALLGRTGLMDEAKAEAYREEKQRRAKEIFAPTEEGWTESPFLKARELLGGSLPYVAAPVAAAGAATLAAPAAPLVATGAALGAGALQYTGTNLGRQMETGKALKDTDLLAAGAAAIPQAALDTLSLRLIPGIGRIFGAAGKKITPEMAKQIAEQGMLKTAGAYALQGVKTAGIEGSTEVAQQFLERLQAGLDIADKEARDEYFESFIGGAVLGGTLSVPGKFMERGGAKQLARAEEQRLQQEADKAAEEQKQAELDEKEQAKLLEAQRKTGDLFGEAPMAQELPGVASSTTVRERERAAQETGVETPTRNELLRERAVLMRELEDVEKQRDAAAEKGDTTTFATLAKRTNQMQSAIQALDKDIKAIPVELTADMEMAQLRGQLKNLTKQLSKQVGPAYDAQAAERIAEKIQQTEARINELSPAASQFELFDEAQMQAEKNQAIRSEREARAQEQADLFAAQTEPKLTRSDEYLKGLQDLEDAYAEGKSDRIIDELIAKLQAIGQEKEAGKVGIVGGAAQEDSISRINRIKRAIAEEEAKLATATTNEEVAEIRANVAALKDRLGIALTESASAQPENLRSKAINDQAEAIGDLRDAVEDLKSGRYFSGRDVATTESSRSGIERKAQKAAQAYIDAAIRDVNAQRALNRQEALSTDEALKLTTDLQNHIGKVIQFKNIEGLMRPEYKQQRLQLMGAMSGEEAMKMRRMSGEYMAAKREGKLADIYSNVEKQLAQIKNRYAKGAPLRKAAEKPFALEQETLPAALRAKSAKEKLAELPKGFSEKDAKELAKLEKERADLDKQTPSMAVANRAKELDEKIKDLRERAGRYLATFGEETRTEKKEALTKAYRDAKDKIAEESEAGKAAEEKLEAEKAKQEAVDYERYAPSGISPDQKDLFAAKDLEPLAIVRATPANFMRFVMTQSRKAAAAIKKADAVVTKTQTPIEALTEKIDKLRATSKEYGAKLSEMRADAAEEAQVMASTAYAKKFYTEGLALAKQLYTGDIANARNTLGEAQFELNELEQRLKSVRLPRTRALLKEEIKKKERAYENAKTKLANLFTSFEATIDQYREAETQKLEDKYLNSLEFNRIKKLSVENAKRNRFAVGKLGFEKEAAAETTRAEEGTAEAKQQKMLEERVKTKRETEQKALEETASLPRIKQTIVPTNRVVPGSDERVLAKRTTGTVFKGKKPEDQVRYPVKPKTAEEKAKELAEKERELAAERKAFREQAKQGLTPQQLEKEIKEFKARAEQSRKEGKEGLAKRQEATAKRLEKELKSKMDVARMAMRGEGKGAKPTPPKMKTGVKAESRGRKAKKDFDEDALDHGVAYDDYMEVQRGLAFGFKARDEEAKTGAGITLEDANKALGKVKLPKGLKVVVVNRLQGNLREAVEAQGMNPDTVRGGVMPNGVVFMVAENHTDLKDFAKTVAHEVTGHLGVEGVLGESGMNALIKKITSQYGSVFKLADQLGVGQDALAAFNAAKRIGKTDEQALASAVREMIAHTEEARVDKNFLAKAGEFIKAMVGAVRAALRKMGVDLDISTSDIFKILRDARKDFNEVAPGAYVNKDGDIMFRPGVSTATGEFANVLRTTGRIVAQQKPWRDRLFGELTGLVFQTKYLDRFAPVQKVLDKTRESLKATQLMYFLRMHDQRMAWTSEIASNGAAVLRAAKDGKGLIVESQKGANLKDIAEALRGAKVGSPEDTNRMFTLYLLAKRAKRVGVDKLNFRGQVTESMLKDAIRAVQNDKPTFDAFEKAAGIYNEYNKGLVNFAVQTGAISKELGRKMLASEDYVPFYREDPKTGNVMLEIGGADPIKIGNVTDQPYLHELIGGDEAVLDFFTSSLQNTAMMTDLALRNLAARNVAFTLGEMGLLKVGEKEKGIGIRSGDGPANKRGAHRTIRFKVDGEDKHVIVDTEAAGVDSELLVRGLEGVNTALPNVVKMMNIPANLLRKWVTRNPAYALRQVIRDPMNAVMVSGVDTIPVVSSLKEISKVIPKILKGEEIQSDLRAKGILGGQVLTGTAEDQKQILTQITSGKAGWDSVWAKADQLAIQGDAATRVVMYNSFIKQGLSEIEATLATLEAMNFSKRGISPSLFALSTMVPFMNAQIQGLNVLYSAFRGKMPFSEKLRIKQKLFQRYVFMFGMTALYAALMQDDEAYQNANDEEKLNNWFVYVPGVSEPVKVPIPFELGILGKALPEALVNTAFGDEKARDTLSALGKMVWNAIPISGPQGVKPLLEAGLNYSFYTGREIESDRLQRFEPGERYNDRTTELAKVIGGALAGLPVVGERFLTPVKLEYLIRGYLGSVPLAVASLANPVLSSGEGGQKPEGRPSDLPLFGSFFQPTDAQGLVNKAYKDVEEINRAKETWKKMEEEGRYKEADAYLDANADVIALASMAGRFRKQMGELTKQEREIKADPTLSAEEKRKALDEIRQDKIQLAKELSSERG